MFLGPAFQSDLARPGAAIYGLNPIPGRPNPMQPVLRLRSQVRQMRELQPGESVGYNWIWTAARPSRVATVSIGYADGYPRSLSNRAIAAELLVSVATVKTHVSHILTKLGLSSRVEVAGWVADQS